MLLLAIQMFGRLTGLEGAICGLFGRTDRRYGLLAKNGG